MPHHQSFFANFYDKTCKLAYSPSDILDQYDHSPSLIRAFTVRSLGSYGTYITDYAVVVFFMRTWKSLVRLRGCPN